MFDILNSREKFKKTFEEKLMQPVKPQSYKYV